MRTKATLRGALGIVGVFLGLALLHKSASPQK